MWYSGCGDDSSMERSTVWRARCECTSWLCGAWQGLGRNEDQVGMDAVIGIMLNFHGCTWWYFLKTYCTLNIIPGNEDEFFLLSYL